ncbi:MAG: hypothetical protein KDD40_09430, partial [Bdellovibrionales bacterium]|nr:hypothetical protein [Bdellovibrionales bacterium]
MDSFKESFVNRHIGPASSEQTAMLSFLQTKDLNDLVKQATPATIRLSRALDLQQGLSESEFIDRAKEVAGKNKLFRNFIGLGYYGT